MQDAGRESRTESSPNSIRVDRSTQGINESVDVGQIQIVKLGLINLRVQYVL